MAKEQAEEKRRWREGYTTGSCAAGAAKAACDLLKGNGAHPWVEIPLPLNKKQAGEQVNNGRMRLPVHYQEILGNKARAVILKDGGDDPDITTGLEIWASVEILSSQGEVHIHGGPGIGTVTKKGLAVPPGEKAINPAPARMIIEAVREVFAKEEVAVMLEVPHGEEIAQRTLNPRLGIVGGISILGTTGIVRPMSEEAFKSSLLPELDQAVAYGHNTIVLTFGNYGFRVATERMQVPAEAVIQMSNFVGYILTEAVYRRIEKVILLGHIGKLMKVSGGIFHTHNQVADARLEIFIAHAALAGIPVETLVQYAGLPTMEAVAESLREAGSEEILHQLAAKASLRARMHIHDKLKIGTVFTNLQGDFIGWDRNAVEMIRQEGWIWPNP